MALKRKKPTHHHDVQDELDQMGEFVSRNVIDGIKADIKCKTENQKTLIKLIKSKEIVICAGLPGTGKTFLSCAMALQLLKKDPRYKKIYIIKSVTTLPGEEIGFLKGTMQDKMEPFMFSFLHNFEKITGRETVQALKANNIIEELPIAYLRGINIDNAIVIIDEAQNISKPNLRTIMTRIGTDSKMIFLGDCKQIDMKNKKESSLQFMIDNFSDLEAIGTVAFGIEDVVRNPIIKEIEERFESLEA